MGFVYVTAASPKNHRVYAASVCAILVFAFGFKSAEQPPFDKLSSIDSEERKTLGKKKKLKEKKTSANGNIVNVSEKIDKSPSKESKKKEQENVKKADNKAKLSVDKKKADPFLQNFKKLLLSSLLQILLLMNLEMYGRKRNNLRKVRKNLAEKTKHRKKYLIPDWVG
ncbi:hypothetical protein Trydic_g17047 [Trypoxylus dichotomus]